MSREYGEAAGEEVVAMLGRKEERENRAKDGIKELEVKAKVEIEEVKRELEYGLVIKMIRGMLETPKDLNVPSKEKAQLNQSL